MLTVIGETLIDEVVRPGEEIVAHVGGSPMNVAVGLARLGHPAQFLGRYGKDAYGQMIVAHLRDNHVLLPVVPDTHPTSTARAVLDANGAAEYHFDLTWDLPIVANVADGVPDFMLAATTLLHTGSIATMLEPGAAKVFATVVATHPRATITYDPNCRPSIVADVGHAREQAEKFVRLADVVKASDEDLAWLYPGVDPLESARRWLGFGPALVVVTRGGDGPWAVCAAGESSCAAPAVDVVDTVGAGDSFMAALLGALVDRELDGAHRRDALAQLSAETLGDIIFYAARAAAITVSRAGANPPSRAELQLVQGS